MKNITVAVSDDVYRRARVAAAERGTSVSALVTEFLDGLASKEAEFQRLLALQKSVVEEIEYFDAEDRVSREELYDRALR